MKLSQELSCSEIVELVTSYLEDGLSAHDRERFEEHLVFCDGCQNYLDQMRQTISATGRLRSDDFPPALQQALLDAFRSWKPA